MTPRRVLLIFAAVAVCGVLGGALLFSLAGFQSLSQIDPIGVAKRYFAAVPSIAGYVMQFFIFLLPGTSLLLFYTRSRSIAPLHILPAIITASLLMGYVAFWLFFLWPIAGKVFSVVLMSVSGCFFLYCFKLRARPLLLQREVLLPGAVYFFAGLFYVGFLWLFDRPFPPDVLAQTRFGHRMPPDNVLPLLLGENLYFGLDPRPLIEDWLSSDRPPLQAGMTMLQRPYRIVTHQVNYQLLGTIYQAIWIPALWSLCRVGRFSERQIAWVYAIALMSGFYLVNNVYIWPKLSAAALCVWAFTLLWEPLRNGEKPSLGRASVAALAAALGFLSHGGVGFTLIVFGVFFLLPRYFIGWKAIVVGCAVFVAVNYPWTLYQKYYEPPGNRLAKLYLAGQYVKDFDSTWTAIKRSYSSKTAAELVEIRRSNFGYILPDTENGWSIRMWIANEYFRVLPGLGAINIGWIGLLCYWLRRRTFPEHSPERAAGLITTVGLASLLAWLLFLGGPALAIIHQGSYATQLFLITGLTVCTILYLPRALQLFALALHIADFVVIWVLSTPRSMDAMPLVDPTIFEAWQWELALRARRLNLVMALTVCVAVMALVYVLRRTRTENVESVSETKQ